MNSPVTPVFIFSLPRSGSTLLQRILASNIRINTTSEPWVLLPLFYSLRKYGVVSEYSHRACFNAISDFVNQMPNGSEDYYKSIGKGVVEMYQRVSPSGTEYFIDKTPRYYLIIDEIVKALPDAKFIFLFRNPLDVFSSILNTWSGNSLKLEKNFIDISYGPILLAKGYKKYKERSYAVKYEDLIINPDAEIESICKYLEIKYKDSMIQNFSSVTLRGSKGDPTGVNKFKQIESGNAEKWKSNVDSKYRKKFVKKLVKNIGRENLELMGYNLDDLVKEINSLTVPLFKIDIRSRLQSGMCHFLRVVDYKPFRLKLERRLIKKDKFQRYS